MTHANSDMPSSVPPRSRWHIPWWVRVAGSVILLGLLALGVDWGQTGQLMLSADPTISVLLVLAYVLINAYNGLRWWVLMRMGRLSVPLWPTVRLTLWSGFVGTFLPGVVGVELIRFGVMSRYTKNPAMVLLSVMLDRLLALLTLIGLVLVGCAISPLPLGRAFVWSVMGCSLGLIVCCVAVVLPPTHALVRRCVPGRLAPRVQPKLDKVFASVDAYSGRPGMLVVCLLLAAMSQVFRALTVLMADRALGIGLDARLYFVIVPILTFIEMVPISISGLGVREVSMLAFFDLLGQPHESGVALALFVLFTYSISLLPGAVLAMKAGPETQPQPPEAQPLQDSHTQDSHTPSPAVETP